MDIFQAITSLFSSHSTGVKPRTDADVKPLVRQQSFSGHSYTNISENTSKTSQIFGKKLEPTDKTSKQSQPLLASHRVSAQALSDEDLTNLISEHLYDPNSVPPKNNPHSAPPSRPSISF